MTDSTVSGGSGSHSDGYVDDLYGSGTESDEVDFTYQHNPAKEEYGPVEQRGEDIDLEHPVADVQELYHRAHLTVQLAEVTQQSEPEALQFEAGGVPETPAAIFDAAILAVADRALEAESVTDTQVPTDEEYVKALLLHDAWGLDSHPLLATHLTETTPIARQLGLDPVPNQSTFWRADDELETIGCRDAVRAAATRAVHAVFRRVAETPQSALTAHGLDVPTAINEAAIAGATHRAAIRNWIDYLLDRVLAPVSFDRAANRSYSVEEILAAVAQAALINGLQSANPTASWYYDPDDIPTAGQVSRLLRSVDLDQILQMFTGVNRRFIKVASDIGFFQRDYDYALDTTWIVWDGKHEERDGELKLIENPKQGKTGKGWLFAAGCVMDLDARFSLGVDLVEDKSETTEQFRFLLRAAGQRGGVGRVHIDREFYDGDAVRMCRGITGPDWTIRAKRQGEAKTLLRETPPDESAFVRDINFSDVTPNPNLYVHPVPAWVRDDTGPTHMAFLTDLSPETTDLASIYERYQKRWTAETLFRQLKHDFGARTSSPSRKLRLFLLNIGALFYNIHTMVNRARSPNYGLRLDVPFYQVLLGVVDTVYTRTTPADL